MTLIRWRPLVRDMESVQEEVNRVFDSFFGPNVYRRGSEPSMWEPEVDISEDKDNLIVQVDLPGMEKDDIRVRVHDGMLTIAGERKLDREEKDGQSYYRRERTFGSFTRTFTLPTTVDGQKIKAAYKNGVLTIDLPKVEAAKPKEIPITVS